MMSGCHLLSNPDSSQYIKTAMGDFIHGDLTPERAAQAVLEKVDEATMAQSGHFLDIEVAGYTRPDGVRKYTGLSLPF